MSVLWYLRPQQRAVASLRIEQVRGIALRVFQVDALLAVVHRDDELVRGSQRPEQVGGRAFEREIMDATARLNARNAHARTGAESELLAVPGPDWIRFVRDATRDQVIYTR